MGSFKRKVQNKMNKMHCALSSYHWITRANFLYDPQHGGQIISIHSHMHTRRHANLEQVYIFSSPTYCNVCMLKELLITGRIPPLHSGCEVITSPTVKGVIRQNATGTLEPTCLHIKSLERRVGAISYKFAYGGTN